jgi:hypothetical protein
MADLSEDILRKIDDFLYNDGRYGKILFYTADVDQGALPNTDAFLREWGVEAGGGAVFETSAERTFQHQPFYPVADYVSEVYMNKLNDARTPFLMPLARPLSTLFASRDAHYTEVLLEFGATAGVRPSDAGADFSPRDAQVRGPLPALVLAGRRVGGAQSHVLTSSSTAMLEVFSIQNPSLSNSEYLINLFNSLSGREDTIAIQPKSLAGQTLAVTTADANRLGLTLAVILPLGILAAGVAVWLKRRYT